MNTQRIDKQDKSPVVEFGFMARPLGEQFPQIPSTKVAVLQRASDAMSILAINGYLSSAQKQAVAKRISASISNEIRALTTPTSQP